MMKEIQTGRNSTLDSLRIIRPAENQKRSGSRHFIWLTGLVGLAIVLVVGYFVLPRTLRRPLSVHTIVITSNSENEPRVLLTGSGYIVTRKKYVIIGTKILGQIISEPIEEGQRVQKGAILAQIDDTDYQAQLREAIANRDLSAANSKLRAANAERARRLIENGTISKEEYDTAANALQVAQAELKRDEAAVDYAKFEVSQCVITSPISGIVLKKYRERGDTINFGGEIQAGGGATDIAQLADTDDIRAEVDINESDISKVALGCPARVLPDAYPERSFDASLAKVYPAADRQKGTIKVEARITNPDLQILKPEMSVKVSFLSAQRSADESRMMVIPKSAVKIEGGHAWVWIAKDSLAHKTDVRVGRESEAGVEIRNGIREGDQLILLPDQPLRDGAIISVEK
jgi:RND family efflux transporter MFP subunit